jgi:hypothetical protein
MYTIKKLYKTYGNRRIQVYDGKKLFGSISNAWGWICIDPVERGETNDIENNEVFKKNHDILRKIAMENLWWLLHTDKLDEDVTELEAWEEKIEYWDRGRINMAPVNNKSVFYSDEEREIARNSINNK